MSVDLKHRAFTERYARHTMLPEIGGAGQLRLCSARVLLVGAGGLGSPAALYLAAAGVGTIGIVDDDTVSLSNLQRQILFGSGETGERKVDAARRRIEGLNPDVVVEQFPVRIDASNVQEILAPTWDVVLDGADNFETRYLVADACRLAGIPLVHGSVYRFTGQVTTLGASNDAPCYRCLYPEPPPAGSVPSCGEIGVLGVLPGIIGTMMATEAIKQIVGIGEALVGRLLVYDALGARMRSIEYESDPSCRLCGTDPEILAIDPNRYLAICGIESQSENEGAHDMKEISVAELDAMRKEGVEHVLVDVREDSEYEMGNIDGTHIPLGQLPERLDEIPEDASVVVMCRSGGRSARAVSLLESAGRTDVSNLSGGILAWKAEIDPTVQAV